MNHQTSISIQQSSAIRSIDLCRFPVFVLRNSRLIPEYTLERVYGVLAWSFRVSSCQLSVLFLLLYAFVYGSPRKLINLNSLCPPSPRLYLMEGILAMTLRANRCHLYMPNGVANQYQAPESFCFSSTANHPNPTQPHLPYRQVGALASWSTEAIGSG